MELFRYYLDIIIIIVIKDLIELDIISKQLPKINFNAVQEFWKFIIHLYYF